MLGQAEAPLPFTLVARRSVTPARIFARPTELPMLQLSHHRLPLRQSTFACRCRPRRWQEISITGAYQSSPMAQLEIDEERADDTLRISA